MHADGIFRALPTPAQGQGVIQEGPNYACIIDISGETYKALFSLEPDAHAAFRAACPLQAQAQAAATAAGAATMPPVAAAQLLAQQPQAAPGGAPTAVNGVASGRSTAAGPGDVGDTMAGAETGMMHPQQQAGMGGGSAPGDVSMSGVSAMTGAVNMDMGGGVTGGPQGGPMGGTS
jgi:hypothetical protein